MMGTWYSRTSFWDAASNVQIADSPPEAIGRAWGDARANVESQYLLLRCKRGTRFDSSRGAGLWLARIIRWFDCTSD